jgi:hypothetical protein
MRHTNAETASHPGLLAHQHPNAADGASHWLDPIRPMDMAILWKSMVSSGLRIAWLGQAEAMGKLISRSTILTAVFAPIAALSLVTPAIGSAEPLNCQNGEWWDPVANVCQPPAVPFPPNCGDGNYWNPVSNACRPLGQV